MGTNTLNNRSAGQTIVDTFFNDIHQAMNSDFVGRNSTGVPTAGQNLGTVALPWGTIRADSLSLGGSVVDASTILAPPNRVVSGKVRTTSNQPQFITPNGAAPSFVLDGTPVNLVLDINGSEVTVTTDITKSSLTTAPGTQNTALVNDTDAADQFDTKTWGEPWRLDKNSITIDTVGTNISALVGKWAAFKIGGVTDEYFLAYVQSATELNRCYRGFFYNASLAPINRSAFSNNDTITLMSLAWVFVENDATTVDVTYNNPTWSFTSPSSPATGDYWYDMLNNLWKRYDGASFQIINRTWVGIAVIDSSFCVAARSTDFYANYKEDQQVRAKFSTTEIILSKEAGSRVNVAGQDIRFYHSVASWNITTDLAASSDMYNGTEQASRVYYLYIADNGETILSDIEPYDRKDLLGYYHPHNPWRAIGYVFNNASNNLISPYSYGEKIFARYVSNGTPLITRNVFSTIVTPQKQFDTHDAFNFSSYVFTAPATGIYMVHAAETIVAYANTTLGQVKFRKNGSDYAVCGSNEAPTGFDANEVTGSGTALLHLSAGDEVDAQFYFDDSADNRNQGADPTKNYFSIVLYS